MGILLNPLGNFSGKVGEVVFRQRNGKTYISKAPKRKSNYVSPETLKRREKFAAAGHIARAVNSITALKELWNIRSKKESSPYNKIFKRVYSTLHENNFTLFGGIIPEDGYRIIKCKIKQGLPTLIIDLISLDKDAVSYREEEVFIVIAGIVVLSEPKSEGDLEMRAIPVYGGIQELLMDFPQEVKIEFSGVTKAQIEGYNKQEYYLHLLTLDKNGKAVRYSERIEESTN